MSAASSSRIAPEELGIIMAPPSKVGLEHATQRLKYQLRVLSFVSLLRAKGVINDSAQAQEAKTQYQHGSGDVGEQAAHKIIVSLAIGGTSLIDLCKGDSALHMAMVFLHSDTTVLPRCWNMADDVIETGGARSMVVTLANSIITKIASGASYAEYEACIKSVWGTLKTGYLALCVKHRMFEFDGFEQARKQEAKVKLAGGSNPNPHLLGELEKAKRLQKDALEKVIVLDVYVEEVGKMGFPLTAGELDNMWELVFGAAPVKVVSH